MRARERDFQEAGAGLAAIGLGDMNYALRFREEAGIGFPLLVDAHRVAYREAQLKSGNIFQILWRQNMQARGRAQKSGCKQHALGKNPFQLGGSFVFAPGDRDLLLHVNSTFSDDADPDLLLRACKRN